MTIRETTASAKRGWTAIPARGLAGVGRREVVTIAGLALLAAAIRFATLAQQSFWLDEGYTEHLVRMSFGGMLHTIPKTESTPPVYYGVAWLWTRMFGFSEPGIRSLSALAGTLTVLAAYAIARLLANRRAALIAGLLVASAPLLVWFSQEARAYALATLFATVTVLCVLQYRETSGLKWLIAWTVAAALGLATHYFVGFVVAPELVWLLIRRRREISVLAAAGAVIAVAIALVPLALAQRGTGHADYISQGSLATRVLQVPKQFLVGYASPSQVLTAVLATLLVAGALIGLIKSGSLGSRSIRLLLAIGLTCVLAPILLAILGVDFVNTRNLLPCLPTLIVVVAVGLDALDPLGGACVAAALTAVFLCVVVLVDTHAQFQRDNWRGASEALGRAVQTRIILVRPAAGFIPLSIYQPGLRLLARPAQVSEIDVVALPPRPVGSAMGHPPRLPLTGLLPPGASSVAAKTTDTYSAYRFKTNAAVLVTGKTFETARLRGFLPLAQATPR